MEKDEKVVRIDNGWKAVIILLVAIVLALSAMMTYSLNIRSSSEWVDEWHKCFDPCNECVREGGCWNTQNCIESCDVKTSYWWRCIKEGFCQ